MICNKLALISLFNAHISIPNSPLFHRSSSSSSSSFSRPLFSTCLCPAMKPDSQNKALRNRVSPVPPMDGTHSSNSDDGYDGEGGFKEWFNKASFRKWRISYLCRLLQHHPIPCVFACTLVFFVCVEYTLRMVPSTSPPFDLGFVATRPLNRFLSTRPNLNTVLAALNTVFVGMEVAYILWTLIIEGRARPAISAMMMFTCRGMLGYSTQLPLPKEYLGSGADFPVGNVSFFLFYSGHVATAVIASLDLRRMQRKALAWTFDVLNVLQALRLLTTRGHYTIDLGTGVGAGVLFDSLAGKYEEYKASTTSYIPLEEKDEAADGNV